VCLPSGKGIPSKGFGALARASARPFFRLCRASVIFIPEAESSAFAKKYKLWREKFLAAAHEQRGDFTRTTEDTVGFIRKNPLNDLVPIHPDNTSNKDWVILLEAGTITGPSSQRIRVARWMQERKIVKKHDIFLRTKYFIVVEGYNPRIHALYFCPQLFRHDSGKLVPLEGEEIGRLIARAVEASASERRPWYEPMEKLPQEPLIDGAMLREFDTLVVERPARESLPAGGQQLLGRPSQPAEAS
jgi:hypothetical protein